MKKLLVAVMLVGMACTLQPEAADIRPAALRCEYREEPLGIDVLQPRLSWTLKAAPDARTVMQSAYHVLVASTPESLAANTGDLWDSGKVASDRQLHIKYEGKPLTSRMRCFWKVRVWPGDGQPSGWSEPALWSMGLFEPDDWGAKWIGDAGAAASVSAVMLRKEVNLPKKPVRATAALSGLGYHELTINGHKVGDHMLDPGFTGYNERVLYVTHDVTTLLESGGSAIGVLLGNGWYNQLTPDVWGFHEAPWIAPPKLLLRIDVEYDDGSTDTIVSDESWKVSTDGPIVYNSIRGGESYDARKEMPGWDRPGYDDSAWANAQVASAPKGRLQAQYHPPIRVVESIRPVALAEPKPDVYVFDLGVNTAGWARLKTRGERGQKITLSFAERLNRDGTVDTLGNARFTEGRYQTGELILAGEPSSPAATPGQKGVEVYEPRFTYYGFRYVQVTGLTEKPTFDSLIGVRVHTDPEPAGEFSCSNPVVNRIHRRRLHHDGRGDLQLPHAHVLPEMVA